MALDFSPVRIALSLTVVGIGVSMLGIVSFYIRHHDSKPVSPGAAAADFLELRARFAGQQPLLEMRDRRARANEAATRPDRPLRSFHTVIFDTRGGERLVRMDVPYWFGRLFARHDGRFQWLGELTFLDDTEFDPEAIELSLEQVERHGPGLIVDYRHPSGGQFLAWVE